MPAFLAGLGTGGGLLLAAGIQFAGNLVGGAINARENRLNRNEARRIDERNFAYHQEQDRLNRSDRLRESNVGIIRNQVDQVNNMLRTNIGLRDRMVALRGGGR
jgi:hypothetical protein